MSRTEQTLNKLTPDMRNYLTNFKCDYTKFRTDPNLSNRYKGIIIGFLRALVLSGQITGPEFRLLLSYATL